MIFGPGGEEDEKFFSKKNHTAPHIYYNIGVKGRNTPRPIKKYHLKKLKNILKKY